MRRIPGHHFAATPGMTAIEAGLAATLVSVLLLTGSTIAGERFAVHTGPVASILGATVLDSMGTT